MFKKRFLPIIFIVCLFWAAFLTSRRVFLEQKNNQVMVAVDFEGVSDLALRQGKAISEVIADLKASGITAIGIKEDSLENLKKRGLIEIIYGNSLNPNFSDPKCMYILSKDINLAKRIQGRLARLFKPGSLLISHIDKMQVVRLRAVDPDLEEKAGMGLSSQILEEIRQSGLKVVLRPLSQEMLTEAREWTFIDTIVFEGKTVIGYPQNLAQTAESLEKLPAKLGIIEFNPQVGLGKLINSEVMRAKLVRVHSVSEKEIKDIQEEKRLVTMAVLNERWVRAVRERNVRLLYLHLFTKIFDNSPSNIYDFNMDYVKQIAGRLQRKGFVLNSARNFPYLKVAKTNVFIIGLGILAGSILMLCLVFTLNDKVIRYLFISGLGLHLSLLLLLPSIWYAKILALASAIIFPLWAIFKIQNKTEQNLGPNYFRAAHIFTYGTLFSLAGTMFIVALLYGQYFWQKIGVFSGIKIALLAPIVLLTTYLVCTGKNYQWSAFWEQKVSFKHLLLLVLVAGGIILYLWRSGNNGHMFVSSTEGRLRTFLDQFLLVRPRTKEFFFGHPLLILSIFLGLSKQKNIILALGGLIGQISIVNTFCHLHTPLKISLLRVFNGWWLGIICGWVLIWAYQNFLRSAKTGEQLCLKF